jgi:hypothetical protein
MDGRRNELLRNRPLENTPQSRHAMIHDTARQVGIDHRLPDGFELQRAEVPSRR